MLHQLPARSITCAVCGLCLNVRAQPSGLTFDYPIEEWHARCHCLGHESPCLCPNFLPHLQPVLTPRLEPAMTHEAPSRH